MTGCRAGAAGTAPAPVTYEFYRDAYGGDLGPEELSAALVAAERHVRWLCGGRVPACEADALAYKRAVCAAADAFSEWGEGQAGSFAIGQFSVTHYDKRGTTGAEMAKEAAVKELCGTGLLFGGAR